MNLDELKPHWQSYKEEVGQQSYVTKEELSEMLNKNRETTYSWYKPSQRILLNTCMSLLLMAMTGC